MPREHKSAPLHELVIVGSGTPSLIPTQLFLDGVKLQGVKHFSLQTDFDDQCSPWMRLTLELHVRLRTVAGRHQETGQNLAIVVAGEGFSGDTAADSAVGALEAREVVK
jgi:hypothetical protein